MLEHDMAQREEGQNLERIFTLSEANSLIPQLEAHWTGIRRAKTVLLRTRDEIRKASAKAASGGGSYAGRYYISALAEMSAALRAIQELGVLVKDLDLGLCDFPYHKDGRIVSLCWKSGEPEIQWWHDIDSGFAGGRPLALE